MLRRSSVSASAASCSLIWSPSARMAAIAWSASPPAFLTAAISSLARLRSARRLSTSVSSCRRRSSTARNSSSDDVGSPRRCRALRTSSGLARTIFTSSIVSPRGRVDRPSNGIAPVRSGGRGASRRPCYPAGTERTDTPKCHGGSSSMRQITQRRARPRSIAFALLVVTICLLAVAAPAFASSSPQPAATSPGATDAAAAASPSSAAASPAADAVGLACLLLPACSPASSRKATVVLRRLRDRHGHPGPGGRGPGGRGHVLGAAVVGTASHRRDRRLRGHVHSRTTAATWSPSSPPIPASRPRRRRCRSSPRSASPTARSCRSCRRSSSSRSRRPPTTASSWSRSSTAA